MNRTVNHILNLLKALLLPASLYLTLLLLVPERMGNWNSFRIILGMSVIPSIAACGVSFGWISGIMDFSIGSCIIFSSLAGTVAGNLFGLPGLFIGAILAALALSAILGGAFRVLRIPSLVISLGMLMIVEVAGNRFAAIAAKLWPDMSTGYYIRLDQRLTFPGTTPWNIIILLAVLAVYSVIYYRTKFSNQARVVGSDEIIARNVGIDPLRVKFRTWLVGAFFLGIAAALTAAYSGSATPQTGMSTMGAVFRPMMCIVIALTMQRLVPVPAGIFMGAFSMNVIFTGIIALGWNDDLQNVLLGLLLIIVVSVPKVRADILDMKRRGAARGKSDRAVQ